MKALLLLALSASAPAVMAQSAMTITAGVLSCGAVRRSVNTVQTYCFLPGGLTMVHNTINLVNPALVIGYQWGSNTVLWKFTIAAGSIGYEATPQAGPAVAGTFCAVYPVTSCGPPTLGTLVSGVCSAKPRLDMQWVPCTKAVPAGSLFALPNPRTHIVPKSTVTGICATAPPMNCTLP